MGKQQGSDAVDFRSLPKAREAIDKAYNLAFEFLRTMRIICCHKSEWASFSCMAFFPEELADPLEEFAKADKLYRTIRSTKANELHQVIEKLQGEREQLRRLFEPLYGLLEYSYQKLQNVTVDGRSWVHAFGLMYHTISIPVEDWGLQYESIWRIPDLMPLDSKLRDVVEKLNSTFPLSFEAESILHNRLRAEKSQILQDLQGYQALFVETEERSSRNKRPISEEKSDQLEIEETLFRRWKGYCKQKELPRNKTCGFLSKNADIAEEYDEKAFKALVDRCRKRESKR